MEGGAFLNDVALDYILENFKVKDEYLVSVHNNNEYNKVIVDYYKKLSNEIFISSSKIPSLKACNKFWLIEQYDHLQVKDFISTNLCKDKFCNNCKKVRQASRMSRFIPQIEPYRNKLFHIVLTIPNIKSDDLKYTVEKMARSFKLFVECIREKSDKRSFLDFKKYGFKGAIRSLEITFKKNEYHPHYHCAFVFENLDLEGEGRSIENPYSHSFSNGERLFTEFEIKIQKLWYLIMNNIRITQENFENLNLGYSCTCDKFRDDDYAEMFKYMTKETDETSNILTYDHFKTLYKSTYHLRQLQGYGCFYQIIKEDLDDEVDKMYQDIRFELLKYDCRPILTLDRPFDLLNQNDYIIISRKKIFDYLKK